MLYLRQKVGPVALATAMAIALAACGGDTGSTADESPSAMVETESDAMAETEPDAMADTESDAMAESEPAAAAGDPFASIKTAADAVGYENNAKALASGIIAATGMEGSVDDPAIQLYANLSQTLQEHVYLAGIAIDAGLSFGLDTPQFEAAAATLDTNSVELADIVGSVAPDQRDAFLELWRQHIGFFVQYTEGAAADDQAIKDDALASLDGYRSQAGAFFETISGGEIPASAVEDSLSTHVQTVTSAIDSLAAGDGAAFQQLKDAATAVGETGSAKALATGIAAAAGLEGNIDSPAAATYATLSTLLEEHVYLTSVGVKYGFTTGLDSPEFMAAAATLDTNSVDLADAVGGVAPDQRDAFLELWRQHIGFFVTYAEGAATDDQAKKDDARASLDGYRSQAGAFFEQISGGEIPAGAVEDGLGNHVDTLTTTIDDLAAALVG